MASCSIAPSMARKKPRSFHSLGLEAGRQLQSCFTAKPNPIATTQSANPRPHHTQSDGQHHRSRLTTQGRPLTRPPLPRLRLYSHAVEVCRSRRGPLSRRRTRRLLSSPRPRTSHAVALLLFRRSRRSSRHSGRPLLLLLLSSVLTATPTASRLRLPSSPELLQFGFYCKFIINIHLQGISYSRHDGWWTCLLDKLNISFSLERLCKHAECVFFVRSYNSMCFVRFLGVLFVMTYDWMCFNWWNVRLEW
ncbi:hypothetical protein PIB30_032508 [Stylosanthes scabra]|uniref:Uncharacterized protein n=1 Tax=Stylosanthes scabra TaxID=79078 RepID=A0ABU6WA78_9FABA|nr:hypothetical protein [Stylosanthes scabra]